MSDICPHDGKYCNKVSPAFANQHVTRLDKIACLVCRRHTKTH